MKEWVGSESGSYLQINAFWAPGDAPIGASGFYRRQQTVGIQANADCWRGFKSLQQYLHIFLFPVSKEIIFILFW